MEAYVIVFPILEEQNRQNNSLLKIIMISFWLLSVTRSWKAQPGSYPTTYIQVLFVRHSGVGQKFQPGHPAPFLSVTGGLCRIQLQAIQLFVLKGGHRTMEWAVLIYIFDFTEISPLEEQWKDFSWYSRKPNIRGFPLAPPETLQCS